ncbi:MAG: 3-dehydroquinate synthase [Gammaproteobacteria bacterium]|nr:3-dehydroquinate synthase [Gammaproteobacteria bacterium]
MKTLQVKLGQDGERSYPIFIGQDLLDKSELIAPYVKGNQVLIVTNETIAPLYLEKVKKAFSAYQLETVILPDGEKYKNLNELNAIYDALLTARFDRTCTLVALGGGVVGDMTGFAAASYQRGVNFIQIPTTLLAQVDSSVGGKTGVNHPKGKNMIGAFHQPQCVIADSDTLNTLEDKQLSAGIAEVIKYGLIRDMDFTQWLEENMHKLLARDPEALSYAIEVSCRCKADIVAADEKEGGVRALLNLGHTFGHAIENSAGYGNWLHGEAVATGMLMAADLSMRMGNLTEHDVERVDNILDMAMLPTRAPHHMDYEHFIELMAVDKKVRAGKINFVLFNTLGDAMITSDYDPGLLRETIEAHRAIDGQ